jgi:glycosyltransferase involved in cell wall biosynthesis
MITLGRPTPSILFLPDPTCTALAATLRAALLLLSDTARVGLAATPTDADIVHTMGSTSAVVPRVTRVHTVDSVALRTGRLAPAHWWLRRERQRSATITAWLTHGRTAGRILVDVGIAPGERVHCMSVLHPGLAPEWRRASARTALRGRLGLTPGVRLVVGTRPSSSDRRGVDGWADAVLRLGRSDIAVATLAAVPGSPGDAWQLRLLNDGAGRARSPRDGTGLLLPLPDILAVSDIVVAASGELLAYNPAAAAITAGVPVVAATTDSAAELVASGRTGFVVPPRSDRLAHAVAVRLDDGLPPARRDVTQDATQQLYAVARSLLHVYQRAWHDSPARRVGGAA